MQDNSGIIICISNKGTHMQPIFLIILVGLLGGMAIGVQSPMSSIISQRMGMMESVFIIHAGGALAALIPLIIFGSKLGEWRSVPWYTLVAGAFGLIVISAMGYMIPRIGVAGALLPCWRVNCWSVHSSTTLACSAPLSAALTCPASLVLAW